MKDTDNCFCRILFDILSARNIRNVVCSPGSRNVPLLKAVYHRPEFKPIMIADERTASFVANGIAIVSQRPVALVCTSGTALLNYAPAIAEAYYQGLPLIVISADRPVQWIDQDDSQTIRQFNVLSNFVKRSYDIPVNQGNPSEDMQWYVERIVNEAIGLAGTGKPGPVHINIQLDTPLSGETSAIDPERRTIEWVTNSASFPPHIMKKFGEEACNKKILIVCGFMPPSNNLNRILSSLSRHSNVYIMAETLSNIHLDNTPYAIDTVLSCIEDSERELLRPDILITLGGSLVSRMVKEFLRKYKPRSHWQLGWNRNLVDCFKALTINMEVEPASFLKAFDKILYKLQAKDKRDNGCLSYRDLWDKLKLRADERIEFFLNKTGWSEFKAFSMIFKRLPSDVNLFLSNGTPVRYAQLFCNKLTHGNYCNRGVSGIEGSTATAAGAAYSYAGNTLLISGDMSFSYDTGVLGLDFIPDSFKILIINNNGGGIFRYISSTRDMDLREEIFSPHTQLPLKLLADAYGWDYFHAYSEEKMDNTFERFLNCKNKAIMEVVSDPFYSSEVLKSFLDGGNPPLLK